jgi:glutathione S-transferase
MNKNYELVFYGGLDSGHSYKVGLFLALAQVPHSFRWVDLTQPNELRRADFQDASKFGEVPVLVDSGQAMCQSNALLIYLAKKTKQFDGGEGQNNWQTAIEWLSWEANRIGFSLPNLRYLSQNNLQTESVRTYLMTRVLADLDTLNHCLEKTSFLLPSGFSIADLSCSAYLFWLHQVAIDVANYPHISRWLDAIRALPHWVHPDEMLKKPIFPQ